jgi:hypothetical protein
MDSVTNFAPHGSFGGNENTHFYKRIIRHPWLADPDPVDPDQYQFQAYDFLLFPRKFQYAVKNHDNFAVLHLRERKTF